MKLRNGKTYNEQQSIKKRYIIKKNIDVKPIKEPKMCNICCKTYKRNQIICSCKLSNIDKHSFHLKCMKTHIRYWYKLHNNVYRIPTLKCPYCYMPIEKKTIVGIKYLH